MERLFFTINELTARAAKEANSMSGYVAGSATSEYQNMVNRVYDTVEKIKEKKPNLAEKAQHMAERYSRKLAEYFNAYYRNEASCPSILISGGGNFPVRKKEKQNSRRETLMNDWKYLENYATKIEHLLAETAYSKCQVRIKQSYQRAGKVGRNSIGGISHGRAFDKANCI